jgi:hypothetical protein
MYMYLVLYIVFSSIHTHTHTHTHTRVVVIACFLVGRALAHSFYISPSFYFDVFAPIS